MISVLLAAACDSGDGNSDTEFDPTFDGGGGGNYLPTAGGSSATFTGGGASTTGATTVGTAPVTSASASNVTAAGSDDSTGGGGSATCNLPCVDSTQCEAGESCLSTTDGFKCLPFECQDCFDQNGQCFVNFDCTFDSCEVDPDNTCSMPCSDPSQCNAGQNCYNLTTGMQCAPIDCQSCFDAGLGCTWNKFDCQFSACE